MFESIRVGRISYRNVLPIYHPLETGRIPNRMRFVYGPPAELNRRMKSGELDIASVSSIEYARRADEYLLLPHLAIGSRGPVQSVLLLSTVPVRELHGKSILVSAETHTSAMLLSLLLRRYWRVDAHLEAGSGSASAALDRGARPAAVLAIGDEALMLRGSVDYPCRVDLGDVWHGWTGLPFVFGVWAMRRDLPDIREAAARQGCDLLLQGKAWGARHLEELLPQAGTGLGLDQDALRRYFRGLSYELGAEEQKGLRTFFQALESAGLLERAPRLDFFQHPALNNAYA